MISPLLTPFRWYDKYHQQNRFESDCADNCTFELITDHLHLLPFQFKRDPSPYLLTDWILRRCCDDPEIKMLDKVDSNFVGGSMSWVDENLYAWTENCSGGICAITGGPEYDNTKITWDGLTVGKTYTYNIIISSFVDCTFDPVSPLTLYVYNGSTLLTQYTTAGIKTLTFTATETSFSLSYDLITDDCDVICIQHVQITQAFELNENDVILDETKIKYFSDRVNDYFVYCGGELGIEIPPGCYYSIIQDEGGNLYFSEVITVKEFFPETSPYLLFEWWNSCDIKDTVYIPITDPDPTVPVCAYKNRLYLSEAVVTKPDYPFKEEGEEDGNQTFNATFQKLDKNILLIVPRVPEYIIDALNGVRLHDTIQFTNPLRLKQEFVDDPIDVISVEADTAYIVNDCFANVTLKCLLDEKYVDETCCVAINDTECKGCVEIPAVDVFDSDVYEYALVLTEGSDEVGLYQYINNEWTLIDADSDILICANNTGIVWQYQPDNPNALSGYARTSILHSMIYVSGQTWTVIGSITTFAYGIVQYSTDGGSTWVDSLNKLTREQLMSGVNIQLPNNPCCGDFVARLWSFDLNGCQYGSAYTLLGIPSPTNDCC